MDKYKVGDILHFHSDLVAKYTFIARVEQENESCYGIRIIDSLKSKGINNSDYFTFFYSHDSIRYTIDKLENTMYNILYG